jgi:predicted RNA polymerase sigma factor
MSPVKDGAADANVTARRRRDRVTFAGPAPSSRQDAFSRLLRARPGEIEDERGWLIVVTSRLCLDQIRSARSRRERPHDASEIEFVATDHPAVGPGAPADPADRVTLDDSVRLALLVMLQRLSPAERVVFVLHDIFSVPFESIAQTAAGPPRRAASWPAGPGRRSRTARAESASTSAPPSTGRSHRSSSPPAPAATWTACSRC